MLGISGGKWQMSVHQKRRIQHVADDQDSSFTVFLFLLVNRETVVTRGGNSFRIMQR